MKNYYLFLFITSLCINTLTLSFKNKMVGASVLIISCFTAYKSYDRIYKNSLSIINKHAHKGSATIEWKQIPFFKRHSITKKYFGKWVFEPLLKIAYTYHKKENEERAAQKFDVQIKALKALQKHDKIKKLVEKNNKRILKQALKNLKKHAEIEKQKEFLKNPLPSFKPVCTQNIVTIDYLNKISVDFQKNLTREQSYIVYCLTEGITSQKLQKETQSEEEESEEEESKKEQSKEEERNHLYLENFLEKFANHHISDGCLDNFYVRPLSNNIERLVNTCRLNKIINVIGATSWKAPEVFIKEHKDKNEDYATHKLLSKNIISKGFLFDLQSIKEFVAIALSTGFSDIGPGNILYGDDTIYYMSDVENLSFIRCFNGFNYKESKTQRSPIDIVLNIILHRKKNINDEGICWLFQFYSQLIKNDTEWKALRTGEGLTMVPLCENTSYDQELFGKTYNISSLENLLNKKENEKYNKHKKNLSNNKT